MGPLGPTAGRLARVRKGILRPGQRRLAWVGFLLLAAYAPLVAWLQPGDTWLMPITVAGLVGYLLVVDDVLRRRSAGDAPVDALTRGHRLGDDPGSSSDAPVSDAMSEVSEPAGPGQRPDR
jgi:hypothetical protein